MKPEYEFLPELFLRAPYYSYNDYDPQVLGDVLGELHFRNALALASPVFFEQLNRKLFQFKQLTDKERFSLLKYYNRMCFRPTPFGSFASFSLGYWSEGEPVRLSPPSAAKIHLLPDLQFLAMARELPQINKPARTVLLNPTIYMLGNEYRFVKSDTGKNGKLNFSLEALRAEPFYVELIRFCGSRQIDLKELTGWIKSQSGCSDEDAAEYISFLLISQVLFSNEMTSLIGAEVSQTHDLSTSFQTSWFKNRILVNDDSTIIADKSAELLEMYPELAADQQIPVFYSALERAWEKGGPGADDRTELSAAIEWLYRLSSSNAPATLNRFIARFQTRFDQRKVPLTIALDPDSGVVYNLLADKSENAGVLADIYFPPEQSKEFISEWTVNHQLLFNCWNNAKLQGQYSPVILPSVYHHDSTGPLPPSIAVMFRKSEEYLIIDYAGGVSATSLIGRFSLFDKASHQLCCKLAELEVAANPDVLFADIDQRSALHSDNINRREKIYDYRINVNTLSSGGDVLPLNDLDISVRGGELILESRSLGKRVIPRLSTAYNYRLNGLGIFNLLCDLQYQGMHALSPFDMELFFPGLSFYPRVVTGQTIICPAKWKFKSRDILIQLDILTGKVIQRVRQFREDNGLPIKLSLGDFDQQLVFDLSNPKEIDFFINCIKGLQNITLHEYLQPAKCVREGNKSFAGQFVAFLVNKDTIYHKIPANVPIQAINCKREFMLGDEWLYLKIFCTPEVADQILGTVLPLFVSRHRPELSCWFFVRYSDGGNHLRLRFKSGTEFIGMLLVSFLSILRQEGYDKLIHNYKAETYHRELERYPESLIELIENVFQEGSALVCNTLSDLDPDDNGNIEFFSGLIIANGLLRTFLKPGEMRGFCETILSGFVLEFGEERSLKIDMDKTYRKLKHEIAATISQNKSEGSLTAAGLLANAAGHIPKAERSFLLADLIHMQMNRNFRSRQRQHEFFVYHCLAKYWASIQAQNRYSV